MHRFVVNNAILDQWVLCFDIIDNLVFVDVSFLFEYASVIGESTIVACLRGEGLHYFSSVVAIARHTLIRRDGSQLANLDSDLYIKSVYFRESNFIV